MRNKPMESVVILGEVATSTAVSTAVATGINAEPLVTALITLGVSIVTMVGGEGVKYLVAWLKKKREDLEKPDDKDK